MNNKAFNISFGNEGKDFYPDNYQLDTSLDNEIINFFKSQKLKEDTYYLSKKTKNKKEDILNDYKTEKNMENINKKLNKNDSKYEIDNDIENEIEEEEEDSSSSSELIYSTFPNNIEITKKNIYEKMNIKESLIKAVIDEYSKTKKKFLDEYNNDKNTKNTKNTTDISDNDKFIINHKEFNKYDLPEDNIIYNNILPFKSNEYLMKNINKCFKVLKNCNKNNKDVLGKVSEWLYTFLLFLEMPISPDNSADLYSINKYIYNNFMKISELKIIYIIICEIFKQILIL